MKSINYLIVELDKAYLNEQVLSNGNSLITNSTIEDVASINRIATVKIAPDFTIIKEGDQVIVHHNIFRLRNNIKGGVSESNYDIGDNQYIVPLTEVFMYRRDSDWIPITPFCFVEPIMKLEVEGFNIRAAEDSHKGNLFHRGIMTYPNQELLDQGVKAGDTVVFSEWSEYEFNIEGGLFYKMSTKDILATG